MNEGFNMLGMYPLVPNIIRENQFIDGFPFKCQFIRDFPASHVWLAAGTMTYVDMLDGVGFWETEAINNLELTAGHTAKNKIVKTTYILVHKHPSLRISDASILDRP